MLFSLMIIIIIVIIITTSIIFGLDYVKKFILGALPTIILCMTTTNEKYKFKVNLKTKQKNIKSSQTFVLMKKVCRKLNLL